MYGNQLFLRNSQPAETGHLTVTQAMAMMPEPD
jgi:hypothetical protein